MYFLGIPLNNISRSCNYCLQCFAPVTVFIVGVPAPSLPLSV
ncbi:unnamed protein product [Penicillium camemberti]|uniref:Str. FM013 n=1 Tax=Penicillium camemberti (strain FM 013) TaxID=1429867 RepID=A0A0G4PYJ1_PENC3|nr:unnamed protein product [Penicillium camemberti]